MGLSSLFQKKTNYFDKKMTPQCGYCQFGKRTKDGNRVLCSKTVNLKEETDSCGKFIYSPLKRVPVKQLKNEGFTAEEEMYAEVKDEEPEEKKPAEKPAPAEETKPAEEVKPAEPETPAETPAETAEEAPAPAAEETAVSAEAETSAPAASVSDALAEMAALADAVASAEQAEGQETE